MDASLIKISEEIIDYTNSDSGLDIITGKMGVCLYFFSRAKLLDESKYQKLAEKLLDDIYLDLGNEAIKKSAYELAQIGIGMNYLIKQKFVQGNINNILNGIDIAVYKKMIFQNSNTNKPNETLLILYFICIRLEKQKKGSDTGFIWEELCIKVFNELYRSIELEFYEEPILFNMDYRLPKFIYVLYKMYSLQFYNYRIIEVIKEISYTILSRIPILHANRLYLLWSLFHLKTSIGLDIFDEQMDLLLNHIDYKKIIYTELRDRNVFVKDGVAGICVLLNSLQKTSCQISFDKNLFLKRIEESGIWEEYKQLQDVYGLITGFSGLLWVYFSITRKS